MLKLSKKTEYALMAVQCIARNNGNGSVTAKEISEKYDISFEMLAKVLQKLAKDEIVNSIQGVKGGYRLTKSPDEITLMRIIKSIEPSYRITDCMKEKPTVDDCSHVSCCMIRDPLAKVQKEIDKIFINMTVNQLL